MSCIRPIASFLLAAALGAGEPAAPTVALIIPDAAGTAGRLAAGPFADAWRAPEMQRWVATLPGAGTGDAAWLGLAGRARQLRLELAIGPPHGGLPMTSASVAVRMPEGQDPLGGPGLRTQRGGAWWLAALGGGQPRVPVEPHLPWAKGIEDLQAILNLPDLAHLVPTEAQPAVRTVIRALGLGRMDLLLAVDAAGVGENARLLGAKLPLKPLDPALLAGFPENPTLLLACGLDGPALAGLAGALVADAAGLEAHIVELTGQTSVALAAAGDGTVVLAVVGADMILSLPVSPLADALALLLVERVQPGEGVQILAAAAEQPVPVATAGGLTWSLRRTPGRWLVSTSSERLLALGSDAPAAFPTARIWPEADGALALVAVDWSALLPWLATTMPPTQSLAATAMRSAARRLPAGAVAISRDGQDVVLRGRNVLGMLAPLSALAAPAAPGMAAQHQEMLNAAATASLTGILIRARLFSKANDGTWPRDVDDLKAWAKDMTPDSLACAGHPGIRDPFCYVQPRFSAPADQPVVVQDPACNDGKGSLVGFADGRVLYMPGILYWTEAKRLSVVSAGGTDGVDASSWATMPKTF